MLRCISVDGRVRFEAGYWFRRNALEDARRLASRLYDVEVSRVDGSVILVWPHTPPERLLGSVGPPLSNPDFAEGGWR